MALRPSGAAAGRKQFATEVDQQPDAAADRQRIHQRNFVGALGPERVLDGCDRQAERQCLQQVPGLGDPVDAHAWASAVNAVRVRAADVRVPSLPCVRAGRCRFPARTPIRHAAPVPAPSRASGRSTSGAGPCRIPTAQTGTG